MDYYFDDENKDVFQGMIVHVRTTTDSMYLKALIDGKEIEITVFDGYFENMLSDHNDVQCIGIIVGHYEFNADYYFHGRGIVLRDNNRHSYILGVGFCEKFNIPSEKGILTEKAVKAFIENKIIMRNKRMDYKQINKAVMDNTIELCEKLNFLKKSISYSISKEYIVFQNEKFESKSSVEKACTRIIISKERTFEAAEKYKNKKVCCLDFANNHSVGGAPWYAGAQEESMCRISTLYPCINAKRKEFYEKHIQEYDSKIIDDMGNDDLIYVPDVVVFKTDESIPKLKSEMDWFKTDVIVSAAPQLGWNYDKIAYKTIMESRAKRILDVAAKEKVEVLILGAFGCGAFHNPPEVVANIFNDMIRNYSFEIVEFAVFCRDDTKNFDIFNHVLSEK